jgi:sulfoxide reductase heme-binding subunit YedZ
MQIKLDITESVMVAGFLLWLLGYRLMHRYIGAVTYIWQVALAFIAASLTAIVETGWYAATTGVMWWRVFSANFDWDMAFRPAHWVLIVSLGITLVSFVWSSFTSQRPKARKVASRAPSGAIQVQSGS